MKQEHKVYGSASTEAWADVDHYEPESHVAIPRQEAVENAKEWVESHEL